MFLPPVASDDSSTAATGFASAAGERDCDNIPRIEATTNDRKRVCMTNLEGAEWQTAEYRMPKILLPSDTACNPFVSHLFGYTFCGFSVTNTIRTDAIAPCGRQ